MSDGQSFDADRIKHMEMIQAVVGRLAGNSFLVKGWSITVTGVFLGFALDRDNSGLAVAAILPILIFWALDAYYLRSERLFRALYDRVREFDPSVEPFFMGATSETFAAKAADASSWPFRRFAVAAVYGALLVATVAVIIVICTGSG